MALVIKSWKINSQPAKGEPYAQVIARQSGLISFLLSLIGVDATTTLIVSSQGFEFERGSLSGFVRRVTPFGHVSSVLYGRFKPWKKTVFFVTLSLGISVALMGMSKMFGVLVLFGGVGLSLLYYFLNRELTIAFSDDGGIAVGIAFKRSVVEGQEIDEDALKRLVVIIEALLRGDAATLAPVSLGGMPDSARSRATAPTNIAELVAGGGPQGTVIPPIAPIQTKPVMAPVCSACKAPLAAGDVFCNACGTRVPPGAGAGAAAAR
jgi:hypothetical protein